MTLEERTALIKEALSWEGTPYHHQAGVKGIGVDCAYLIGHIAKNAGLIKEFQVQPYSIEWHIHNSEEKMIDVIKVFGCTEVPLEEMQPGDILAFQYGRSCSHLALLLEDNFIIHASIKHGKVMIEELRDDYLNRLRYAFKYNNQHRRKNDN